MLSTSKPATRSSSGHSGSPSGRDAFGADDRKSSNKKFRTTVTTVAQTVAARDFRTKAFRTASIRDAARLSKVAGTPSPGQYIRRTRPAREPACPTDCDSAETSRTALPVPMAPARKTVETMMQRPAAAPWMPVHCRGRENTMNEMLTAPVTPRASTSAQPNTLAKLASYVGVARAEKITQNESVDYLLHFPPGRLWTADGKENQSNPHSL